MIELNEAISGNVIDIKDERDRREGKSEEVTLLDSKKWNEITCRLLEIPWQWYCSMNLPDGSDYTRALLLLNKWQVQLFLNEKIKIGCWGVYDPIPHSHLHIVAIGSCEHVPVLLREYLQIAENQWVSITNKPIFIKGIDEERHLRDVIKNILLENTPSNFARIVLSDHGKQLYGMRLCNQWQFDSPVGENEDQSEYNIVTEKHRWFLEHIRDEVYNRKNNDLML
jgi:hypothetical protein